MTGEGMLIPRNIHQIYFDFGNAPTMPKEWAQNRDRWINLHPTYTHKLWGYNECVELVERVDPDFLETFYAYPHDIQRVDAVRNFILYEHGGIYVDLDTAPLRNLTGLVDVYTNGTDVEVLIAQNNHANTVSNWFMASAPGSEFWKPHRKELRRGKGCRETLPRLHFRGGGWVVPGAAHGPYLCVLYAFRHAVRRLSVTIVVFRTHCKTNF